MTLNPKAFADAISQLERLRAEARSLSNDSNCFSERFQVWHLETVRLLAELFDLHDSVRFDFSGLQFERPSELQAVIDQRVEELKRQGFSVDFRDDYFRKSMVLADEIIGTAIWAIQRANEKPD